MVSRQLVALSKPPAVDRWLDQTTEAVILHLFERACNLQNQSGNVLSLISSGLDASPFALVIADRELSDLGRRGFLSCLTERSSVMVTSSKLKLGHLTVDASRAVIWQPQVPWESADHRHLAQHAVRLTGLLAENMPTGSLASLLSGNLQTAYETRAAQAWTSVAEGLSRRDMVLCRTGVLGLAGLGPGLTPAGDDFLAGVLLALWILWPPSEVTDVANAIVSLSSPRTTSLSAASLAAAGRGEANVTWHRLVAALMENDQIEVEQAARAVLATGHTSGADSLAGFLAAVACLAPWRHEDPLRQEPRVTCTPVQATSPRSSFT